MYDLAMDHSLPEPQLRILKIKEFLDSMSAVSFWRDENVKMEMEKMLSMMDSQQD
jgi:hypothetical protein